MFPQTNFIYVCCCSILPEFHWDCISYLSHALHACSFELHMLLLLGLLLQRSLAAMVASVLNGGDWRPKNIGKAEPLKKEFFNKKKFSKKQW